MHRGCFVWTPTPPLLGRRKPRPGPVCVCVCVLSWPGRVGRRPGRVSVRLTLSCGRSCCSLCLHGPLRAGAALLVLFLGFSLLLCAPLVSGVPCFPAQGALGLGVLWSFPALSFFFSFPPPDCLFVCFVFIFRVSFFSPPFSFVLCWLCGARLVCRGLWGVLVCVVVGLVLRLMG